ncbi:MAG: IS91 family transposase [Bryobacteraceae bacterium]|nr:IS91 family transposase [Bryobacteraceae bacterium]
MNRPALELADIVRALGNGFIERNRSWLTWPQLKALLAIQRCRTAALGGHLDGCSQCGHQAISYNSCRNRHCPRCQTSARDRWLAERSRELLPVPYSHVVFTIPHQLAALAYQNKRVLYDLLLRTSAATLLEIAADSRHLGADIGFLSVLHTWGQNLQHHPHVHCVVPTGGLAFDQSSWSRPRQGFFLPVKVLSKVFRGKFVAGLRRAFGSGRLAFHGELKVLANQRMFCVWVRSLYRTDWVVYAKKPFGGPQHVLEYLARYTHRVAISNHRLLAFREGQVSFRWKDYAHGNKRRKMTLSADEFLRRFLLHVLPRGFVRIRFFGFLSRRKRARLLPVCRALLGAMLPDHVAAAPTVSRLFACPYCGGTMIVLQRFTSLALRLAANGAAFNDSS